MFKLQVDFTGNDVWLKSFLTIKLEDEDLEDEEEEDIADSRLEIAQNLAEEIYESVEVTVRRDDEDDITCKDISVDFDFDSSQLTILTVKDDLIYSFSYESCLSCIEGSLIIKIKEEEVKEEVDTEDLDDQNVGCEVAQEIAEERAQEHLSDVHLDFDYASYEEIHLDNFTFKPDYDEIYWELDAQEIK